MKRRNKRMKRKKDKGFTLVELIVVLVILAILAAILVPALLGYIDRAKEKQYVLNAKSALTATQAELSSMYGEGVATIDATALSGRATVIKNTADTPKGSSFYIAINAKADQNSGAVAKNHDHYTVTNAYYLEDGYYCTYNGKTWTTTQTAPTAPSGSSWTLVYSNTSSNNNSGNGGNGGE
jgi:prepilin-type N-terminal cleavage/methylation domain-containing protein